MSSFISSRSVNKGASGSLSDWLPAGVAGPRAPPQQMDPSRSPPPLDARAPVTVAKRQDRETKEREEFTVNGRCRLNGEKKVEEENRRACVPGFGA
ncbi:hypothetical protein PFLUV_G00072720 [Scomber scombrus]|uniref:Uncharacterized protein n=1 Tax=Scomber scombrus TaxID=13677 RepID=A0AAV1MUS7_SCOSC